MDLKRIVGAYLVVNERTLFEVTDVDDDGLVTACNCKTGYSMVLTDQTVDTSRLIRAALDGVIASLDDAAERAVAAYEPPRTWPGPNGWGTPPLTPKEPT